MWPESYFATLTLRLEAPEHWRQARERWLALNDYLLGVAQASNDPTRPVHHAEDRLAECTQEGESQRAVARQSVGGLSVEMAYASAARRRSCMNSTYVPAVFAQRIESGKGYQTESCARALGWLAGMINQCWSRANCTILVGDFPSMPYEQRFSSSGVSCCGCTLRRGHGTGASISAAWKSPTTWSILWRSGAFLQPPQECLARFKFSSPLQLPKPELTPCVPSGLVLPS